jgi:hypothetical protein
MAYESFTVDDVKQKLGLSVREAQGIFAGVPPVAPSAWLEEALREGNAAQLFNERRGSARPVAHGAVTTGNVWRFLRLSGGVAEVDMTEVYIDHIDRVLGVLVAMTA